MLSAGELELDLHSIVETELLSFNRHIDPLLVPVDMNDIELPEETSVRLLGLNFTQSMDWKPGIQSFAKASSRKVVLPS